jgi:hypothetical protein
VALIRWHVGHDAMRSICSIRTDRLSRLAAVFHQLMRLSTEGSVRFGEIRVMLRCCASALHQFAAASWCSASPAALVWMRCDLLVMIH